MNELWLVGGKPLRGTVRVEGAKNAVLPMIAACLLAEKPTMISNVPHLRDVTTMIELLMKMGVEVMVDERMCLHVDASKIKHLVASYELVKAMRASVLVLGPLLARYGRADVALPGGCAIGTRPIDFHLDALKAMGAHIHFEQGYIRAQVEGRLQGCHIHFPGVTVTGTENLMMAAVLAEGTTILDNAACEPEVEDLGHFLNHLGAKVSGMGTTRIEIEGVTSLENNQPYHVMPDRIEAGTYLIAAAATRGCVKVTHVNVDHLSSVLDHLRKTGAHIECGQDWVQLDMQGQRPRAINIETAPYPGFPTDLQPQFLTLNILAEGASSIIESIFENRYMHIPELQRMGADIKLHGDTAVCQGVEQLHGVPVQATDLRAAASLLIAGLAAQGETCIAKADYIDRGYACVEEKCAQLGATIKRQ